MSKMKAVSRQNENAAESNLGPLVAFFDLPVRTPSLNQWQRMHWASRSALKKSMLALMRHGGTRYLLGSGPRVARITRTSPRELDYDNLVGGCKPLVDAMVMCGLLIDDSPEHVRIEYLQEKGSEKRTRVEIFEAQRVDTRQHCQYCGAERKTK